MFDKDWRGLLAQPRLRVTVNKAGVYQFPSCYRYDCHAHAHTEVICVDAGVCILGVDEQYLSMKVGDCLILYPGVPHYFVVDDKHSCRITQVEFSLSGLEGDFSEIPLLRGLQGVSRYDRFSGCDEVKDCICRIGQKQQDAPLVDFYFAELFFLLSRGLEKSRGGTAVFRNPQLQQVLEALNESVTAEVDIEALCQEHGVSSRYLRRKFQEVMGINVSRYLILLRVNKAKELLADPGLSVTEIAFRTGFPTSQYFSRVFKSVTGLSPLGYRRGLLESG